MWDLSAFDFLKGDAPPTVNPSLWRQAELLAKNGLFKVTDRVYQVRGFDLANITFVRGRHGLDRHRHPDRHRNRQGGL